jgi:type IV pilus assembly protein PilQ
MIMSPRTWIAAVAVVSAATATVYADERNEVRAVTFDEDSGVTRVHVRGAETPMFTVYKLERPARVVIDLPKSRLAEALRGHDSAATFTPGTWAVSTIAAQQLDDGAVRVIVTLSRPGRYDVKTDGSEVIVSVMPRDPAPKIASPAELEAAKKQADTARADAEAAKAEADRLRTQAADQIARAEAAQRAVASASSADVARAKQEAAKANADAAKAKADAAKAQAQAQAAQTEADRTRSSADQARREALAEADRAKADAARARDDMAKAQTEAAQARDEMARANAQAAQAKADAEQKMIEMKREAEAAKSAATQQRAEADKAKTAADRQRAEAEVAKSEAARMRAEAELAKATADKERADAETARRAADVARQQAEAKRAEADAARLEAQQAKTDAKTQATAQAMIDATRAKDEIARARSEADAARAETARAKAEAEAARRSADAARAAAAADKQIAEADKQKAEAARLTSEKLLADARAQVATLEKKQQNAQALEDKARATNAAAQAREEAARQAAAQAAYERELAEAAVHQANDTRDRAAARDRDKAIADARAAEDRLAKARTATDAAEAQRAAAEQAATAAKQELDASRTALAGVEQQRSTAVVAATDAARKRSEAEAAAADAARRRNEAEAAAKLAGKQKLEAEDAARIATKQKSDAEAQRVLAEQAAAQAKLAAQAADKQRAIAEQAATKALAAKQDAEGAIAQLTAKRQAAEHAAAELEARSKAEAKAQAEVAAAKARKAGDDQIAAARAEVDRLAAERKRAEADLADRRKAVATQEAQATRLAAAAEQAKDAADREQTRKNKLADERAREEQELAKLKAQQVQTQIAAKPAKVRISEVSFEGDAGTGHVELAAAGDAAVSLGEVTATRVEVIVDHADLAPKLERTLDVSRFGSPVKRVSSYRDRKHPDRVHIVAELSRPASPTVDHDATGVHLHFVASDVAKHMPRTQDVPSPVMGGFGAVSTPIAQASVSQVPAAGGRKQRIYHGATVDFDFKDAPIHDLLRFLADTGHVNIVVPDTIDAKVTVRLKRVPWDEALEVILASHGLWYRREGNLYRIAPRKDLDAEDEAEAARREAQIKAEPPRPEVVTLNYANAAELKNKLEGMLSPKGKMEVDERTNALIVNDVAGNREQIQRLALGLDTQTPQITIEARIVEARSTFTREIGIQWGGNALAGAAGGNATGLVWPSTVALTGANTDQNTNSNGVAQPSDFAVNIPAATGTGEGGAIGLSLGSVGGNFNINLRLSALEDEGTVRIISAPKVTVLNNREAKISQGVSIPISVVSAAGTNTQFVQADLALTVTPHVSQGDCAIAMQLIVTKNEPDFVNTGARGDPTILRKEARTQMLVNDGDTAVLGGIYTRNTGLAYKKVPFLGDLPVIGWLFKNRHENDDRTEILVFITPKVTNKASLRCTQ